MMVDEPSSSWHPALMPNSAADIETRDKQLYQRTDSDVVDTALVADVEDGVDAWLDEEAGEITHSELNLADEGQSSADRPEGQAQYLDMEQKSDAMPNTEQTRPTSQHSKDEQLDLAEEDKTAARASHDEPMHFSRDGHFVGSMEETVQAHLASNSANSASAEATKAEQDPEVQTEPGIPSPLPQHSSSMSFARTVSHEVNFNDEEEGDWSSGQADTDAVEIMPFSENENVKSFPSAPSATSPPLGLENIDIPLAANQAIGVMIEDELDAAKGDAEYQQGFGSDDHTASAALPQLDQAGYHLIGGDVADSTAVAQEARFEEGLPLIAHSDNLREDVHVTVGPTPDPFAEVTENEDDFFAERNAVDADDNQNGSFEAVERKSTLQVVESLDSDDFFSQVNAVDNSVIQEPAEDDIEARDRNAPATVFVTEASVPASQPKDLTSKWAQAFGEDDEDEFLADEILHADKEVDETAFLGSDDEGLLEDDLEETDMMAVSGQKEQRDSTSYVPAIISPERPDATTRPNALLPDAFLPNSSNYAPQSTRTEASRAQSFADKSKDGYSSPYDLPTDLVKTVKPRKRPSFQQLAPNPMALPPRSASAQPPERAQLPSYASAPPPAPAFLQPADQLQPAPNGGSILRSKSSFFEELPLSAKPRPTSRQNPRAPSPSQYMPTAASLPAPPSSQHVSMKPSLQAPPTEYIVPSTHSSQAKSPPIAQTVPPPISQSMQRPSQAVRTISAPQTFNEDPRTMPLVPNLVAPPRTSPYAPFQAQPAPVISPSSSSSRHSPVPPGQQSVPVSAVVSRYSPGPSVPAAARPNSAYSAVPPSHNVLPHLPRTSSPLAHFETSSSSSDGQHYDPRASSSAEPRLNRVSSLPPTREVDEEEETRAFSANVVPVPQTRNAKESRYSPASPDGPSRNHHYWPSNANGAIAAPPTLTKTRSSYSIQEQFNSAAAQPLLNQTSQPQSHQFPNATQAALRRSSKSSDHQPWSSAQVPAPSVRARGQSMTNMAPPTNGTEHDPLERWRGAPVFAWGVGGTFVTTFPRSTPRYAMGQTAPVMIRAVGVVKAQNIKDIAPLQDRLAKFPGPLKGKTKRKEAIAWLTSGIEALEKDTPDISFHSQLSLDAKRSVERILLWKLLRIFIEHDGNLEGTPSVDTAVRELLAPEINHAQGEATPLFTGAATVGNASLMQADGSDLNSVETIRVNLLKGDREKAIWTAVDKRLWGHAMLLSQTVSPSLYKQVAEEFVRKEVNYPGHSNESLAALYKILSGNYDDCVDELVSPHARAGMQLISTETSSGSTKDAMDGLDKWQETLTLVLSNRSGEDTRGLKALGKLLSQYGRAEAAHICFIFSRSQSVFGGLQDSNSDFVLLGADHARQPDQLAKELEALQLSEVFEYGLSLGGSGVTSSGAPHLSAYKLQYAMTLAEHGFRDKALQYCEHLASAIVAQTRRSPYHHPVIEASVEDLMARLRQAPKEASTSWISKPTVGKVSDSMWNRFNKFVSGDEDGNGHTGSEADAGVFARIASTPNISRPPSTSNTDIYSQAASYQSTMASAQGMPGTSRYAPTPSASLSSVSASQYAPATQPQFAPVATSGIDVQQYAPSQYGPNSSGLNVSATQHDVHQYPADPAAEFTGFSPVQTAQTSFAQHSANAYQPPVAFERPLETTFSPNGLDVAGQGHRPSSSSHGSTHILSATQTDETQQPASGSSYEPPSYQPYSYEPPSYHPEAVAGDAEEPKKKSFMDDDDDEAIPALKKPVENTKAEKDRENEEMFRKAAEEDAKRAAAAAGAKKGWGFGGWFGGSKKADGNIGEAAPGKPIKAKLGEQSSFVYDPDLKRWINKKPGAENVEAPKSTPPPPRMGPRSVSDRPPSAGTPPPTAGRSSVPPMGLPPRSTPGNLPSPQSTDNAAGQNPPMGLPRSVSSGSVGGSRPTTSMSNASSIDDLLGAPGPRKAGQKKPRKSGRYVDVMAK